MNSVGYRIRELRKRKQWTQQDLAEKCGLSVPWTISKLENQGANIIAMLEIVCKALEIEVWELLRDSSAEEFHQLGEFHQRQDGRMMKTF